MTFFAPVVETDAHGNAVLNPTHSSDPTLAGAIPLEGVSVNALCCRGLPPVDTAGDGGAPDLAPPPRKKLICSPFSPNTARKTESRAVRREWKDRLVGIAVAAGFTTVTPVTLAIAG